MSIITHFTKARRRFSDDLCAALYAKCPVAADEITRISGWFAFFSGWTILADYYGVAAVLLFVALILDAVDGSFARLQGQSEPQIDWAMDRFTEAVLSTALVTSTDGSIVSWAFVAMFVSNVFLPRWGIPVLIHRWGVFAYLIYLTTL